MLQTIVEKVFTYPPIFKAASNAARKKIMERGRQIGLDFSIDRQSQDWNAAVEECTRDAVTIPEYYKVPFHAYEEGNLSIDAALEVTNAAKSVHATVFPPPPGQDLDPDGDARLRRSYSTCMKSLLDDNMVVLNILDIGAATGLSSMELLQAFDPTGDNKVHVVGLDLSPYFVAVGQYELRDIIGKGQLALEHGLAENMEYEDEGFDLVSMCLVCHELPQHATKSIFQEAYRVLRPGGALCVMEMDPTTPEFQRVMNNPIPYAIFKSTEPHLLDYCKLDMHAAMAESGFARVSQMNNSPRHKTVVAIK